MVLECFTLLVFFFTKCLGHTEFIYTTRDNVELICNTKKWQISTMSDNRVDSTCSLECVHGEQLELNNVNNSCMKKVYDKVGEQCHLIATTGFYRCVTSLDPGFLYPFKPSPNTVTSYIVSTGNNEWTPGSVVQLTEGKDVFLTCSFNITQVQETKEFTVYWIKTAETSSICVYSYDYDHYNNIGSNQHCNVSNDLKNRISYRTEGNNKHPILISNVTGLDAGRYLCGLLVNANWTILKNITVNVHNIGHRTKDITEDKGSKTDGILMDTYFIAVCATIPILLALAVAAVVFVWKNIKTSPGSQAIERNQHGDDMEETTDVECSPYAVGSGEEEMKFRSNQDEFKQEPKDFFVKLNDLYEGI